MCLRKMAARRCLILRNLEIASQLLFYTNMSCVYMYVHNMYVLCVCTLVCVYVPVFVLVCMYVFTSLCVCVSVFACMCACTLSVLVCAYVYMCVCLYVYCDMCVWVHICV